MRHLFLTSNFKILETRVQSIKICHTGDVLNHRDRRSNDPFPTQQRGGVKM